MRSVPIAEPLTADEYLAAQWRPDTQLIAGELVVNSPDWEHQLIASRIYLPLGGWTQERPGRGYAVWELDVKLGEHDVYRPDILWFRDGRVPVRGDRRPFTLPDLAVEVRSPSTWRLDVGVKRAVYEQRGLPELWLVDTAADVVHVFRRSAPTAGYDIALELGAGDALTSPLLPGLRLALGGVFVEAR